MAEVGATEHFCFSLVLDNMNECKHDKTYIYDPCILYSDKKSTCPKPRVKTIYESWEVGPTQMSQEELGRSGIGFPIFFWWGAGVSIVWDLFHSNYFVLSKPCSIEGILIFLQVVYSISSTSRHSQQITTDLEKCWAFCVDNQISNFQHLENIRPGGKVCWNFG